MYTVYKHTAPNGKVYIGITRQKPKKRWRNGNGYKNNKYLYRAIRKYTWKNFKHENLYEGLEKEEACDLEIKLIAEYHATDPRYGYNISTGGECGTLGVHLSAETRRKLSEAKKGANHPYYGKHLTAEHRRKISEANRGKHPTKAVICIETGILYSSCTEAAKSIGVATPTISRVLRGIKKTSGGYHWKYAEDMEESK